MLHAVIVGVDIYRERNITDLSFARADAEAFGRLLEERIRPSDRKIHLLLDKEATKRNLMVAIGEDLARSVRPEDVVLLFFACHGSPETDSAPDKISRYLVVHDTEYENIYATGIDMELDLKRWYERIQDPKLVLLFIDACFSGRAGGRTFEGPNLYRAHSEFRSIEPISIQKLELGEGRIMIAACDDNQVAREDKRLGHGIFTHYLIEALTRPTPGRSTIAVTSLYDEVARAVENYTSGRQIPIINGRSRFAHLPLLHGLSSHID